MRAIADKPWVVAFTVAGEFVRPEGLTVVAPGTPQANDLAELGCDQFLVAPAAINEPATMVIVELNPDAATATNKALALKLATAVLDMAQRMEYAPSGDVVGVVAEHGHTISELHS